MSCMSQNFRLFLVSNLSVQNFRIFQLMYPGSQTAVVSATGQVEKLQSATNESAEQPFSVLNLPMPDVRAS